MIILLFLIFNVIIFKLNYYYYFKEFLFPFLAHCLSLISYFHYFYVQFKLSNFIIIIFPNAIDHTEIMIINFIKFFMVIK